MPVPNSMGVTLTAEQYTDISDAMSTIIDTLNELIAINLTPDERSGIQSVAEKRLPYVEKSFDSLIPDNPGLVPTAYANLTEGNTDYDYLKKVLKLKTKLLKAVEILSDHELAVGSRCFEFMRDFYHMAQRAAERNVPGADSVVAELAPLFEQENEAAPAVG